MTMQVRIQDDYADKFKDFIDSLPIGVVEVNKIDDDSISLKQAKEKVNKSMDNISANHGIDLNSAFQKVLN